MTGCQKVRAGSGVLASPRSCRTQGDAPGVASLVLLHGLGAGWGCLWAAVFAPLPRSESLAEMASQFTVLIKNNIHFPRFGFSK